MDNLENNKENKWTEIIEPQSSLLSLNLKEVWRYRDLLLLLVKRDFVTYFKQTILGQSGFVNPIFTTVIYTLVLEILQEFQQMELLKLLFIYQVLLCGTIFQPA